MPVVLITGAARGLGLGLTRRYLESGASVIAAVRDPSASAIQELKRSHGARLEPHRVDLADFASIDALGARLAGQPIDVLVGNAAMTAVAEDAFGSTNYEKWAAMFRVNTMSQLKLAEVLQENVAASEKRTMFFVSSRVGAAPPPGLIPFRTSKSALNQVVFQLSLLLRDRGICVACGHPGFVRTDATKHAGVFTVDESAALLAALIDRLSLSDSGKFFEPDGGELPIVTRQLDPAAFGAKPLPGPSVDR